MPDPRDIGKFGDASLPQPPSFNETDVSDKPWFLAHQRRLTDAEVRRQTARYRCGLASLQEVDRTVGRLYGELRDLGELSRTVFIFYTDNGVFFGEHRIGGGKLYPYEEADRTPLYIRLPPRYRGPRVTQVSQPVANIDLAPTMLALAHARSCSAPRRCRVMDGRNLLPLLRGRSPGGRHTARSGSSSTSHTRTESTPPASTRASGSRERCSSDTRRSAGRGAVAALGT